MDEGELTRWLSNKDEMIAVTIVNMCMMLQYGGTGGRSNTSLESASLRCINDLSSHYLTSVTNEVIYIILPN